MNIKLLTEHHLEFLCFTGGCTGLSESTLVKMPHCWKSHVTAHIHIGQHRRIWYLSQQETVNAHKCLHLCAVLSESLLLEFTKYRLEVEEGSNKRLNLCISMGVKRR